MTRTHAFARATLLLGTALLAGHSSSTVAFDHFKSGSASSVSALHLSRRRAARSTHPTGSSTTGCCAPELLVRANGTRWLRNWFEHKKFHHREYVGGSGPDVRYGRCYAIQGWYRNDQGSVNKMKEAVEAKISASDALVGKLGQMKQKNAHEWLDAAWCQKNADGFVGAVHKGDEGWMVNAAFAQFEKKRVNDSYLESQMIRMGVNDSYLGQ